MSNSKNKRSYIKISNGVLKETGRIVSGNNTRYPTGKNASKMPDSNPFADKQSRTFYKASSSNPFAVKQAMKNNYMDLTNGKESNTELRSQSGTVSSMRKQSDNPTEKQVRKIGFKPNITLQDYNFGQNNQQTDKELEETIAYLSSSDNMSQLNNNDIIRKHLERVADFFEQNNWKGHAKAQAMVDTANLDPLRLVQIKYKLSNAKDPLNGRVQDATIKVSEYNTAKARQSLDNQARISTALVNGQRRKVTNLENATTHKASSSKVFLTPQQLALREKEVKLSRSEIDQKKQILFMFEEQKKAQDAAEQAAAQAAADAKAKAAAQAAAEAETQKKVVEEQQVVVEAEQEVEAKTL